MSSAGSNRWVLSALMSVDYLSQDELRFSDVCSAREVVLDWVGLTLALGVCVSGESRVQQHFAGRGGSRPGRLRLLGSDQDPAGCGFRGHILFKPASRGAHRPGLDPFLSSPGL